MKKNRLLIIFIIAMSSHMLVGQHINKGTFVIGGSTNINLLGTTFDIMSINYTSYKDERGDEYSFTKKSVNLSPKIGYFILDKFAFGLDFNFAFTNTKNTDYDRSMYFVGLSPWIRYYIYKKNILPFVEVNGLYGMFNSAAKSGYINDRKISGLGVGVGFSKPLGEQLIFDLSLIYTESKKEITSAGDLEMSNTVGIRLGFNMLLGVKNNTN